ncbi:MAG: hypothetical protein R3D33_15390 [Hyphomicrobiaceae bacterium]
MADPLKSATEAGRDRPEEAEMRRLYEAGELSLPVVAARFGISPRTLGRRAAAGGWTRRAGPQLRGRAAGAGRLSGGAADRRAGGPARSGEDDAARSAEAPGETPLPGSPAMAPQAGKARGRTGGRHGADALRHPLRTRLYRAIDRKLTMIEQRLSAGRETSAADSEREARELGALIRSLERLEAGEQVRGPGEGAGIRRVSGTPAAGEVNDAERWRAELARRISRLREQGGS